MPGGRGVGGSGPNVVLVLWGGGSASVAFPVLPGAGVEVDGVVGVGVVVLDVSLLPWSWRLRCDVLG